MVAGIKSERWPTSNRNHWPDCVGIRNRDLNLRSAYIHVLADAATSVLAIAGLSLAWGLGWRFIDPLIGLAGTAVIGSWAWGLLRATGRVLVDAVPDAKRIERAVRDRLEPNGDRMTDFHLWQVGPGHLAVIVSLVSDAPCSPSSYRAVSQAFRD